MYDGRQGIKLTYHHHLDSVNVRDDVEKHFPIFNEIKLIVQSAERKKKVLSGARHIRN